jgi:NADPH2:quinone reductase
MRAAYYEANGNAVDVLKVGEVEKPQPGPGEVLVRLKTSGVNPSDVKNRMGRTAKIAFPRVIPHSDGAGEIDEVGEGVPHSRVGERVWTWNAQFGRPFGTAAEYVVLPAAQAVPLPANTSFDEGACLGIPAMTAWHAVAVAGLPEQGGTVLISGGAGAVSQHAIQFAKARGATVITTISSPTKAKIARELGADHTIDYKHEDVAARVMEITDKRGVNAILEMDFNSNAKLIPAVLQPHGTVVIYGITALEGQFSSRFCLSNAITLKFILVYLLNEQERAAAIAGINGMLEEGRLITNVPLTLPLKDVAAAHVAVENGQVLGNVVLRLG